MRTLNAGQLPASASKLSTSAILPLVADMLIRPPVTFAAGSGAPFAPPDASEIR